ncbi:MFS transporter [Thalassolituus sp. LLYu03]|uniref:MFS transporter n=1 Tax=Thalassolituus sp. LLYu03 TaxID=3421656 RepID=UPI003D2A254F
MSAVPSRNLASFYFLYFGVLGCVSPYWALYLQGRGFSPQEIGSLIGAFGLMRIVAPNVWAALGHSFPSPLYMVRLAGALTIGCFACIWLADTLQQVMLVMLSYGFFWAAMLPQYEAITMQSFDNKVEDYSRIRMWGSVGFIALVMAAGVLFDVASVLWLPLLIILLMVAIVINSFILRSHAVHKKTVDGQGGFLKAALTWPVISFLLMGILLQISHGPFYTFFSIYLEEHGYPSTQIGLLWAVGVIAEVILFWQFRHMITLFSWRGWCMVSLALTGLRWLVVAFLPEQPLAMIVAQTMHAFSFGAMHIIAMRYVQLFFPGRLQGQGQALYSSIGFGLGGAAGAWLSGQLWESAGSTMVFILAALAAVAGMAVVAVGLKSATDCPQYGR